MPHDDFEQLEADFSESVPDVPEPDVKQLTGNTREEQYFQLFTTALHACMKYKPMFGKGRKGGVTLEQFKQTYGADPFYHWVGLDSPFMYAAHKAAGGMTSIYRQIGIGSEWIFRRVLQDSLNLTKEQSSWSYQIPSSKGKSRTLTLDGRIQFDHVRNPEVRERIETWAKDIGSKLFLPQEMSERIKGVVFEVRQGYKSKDSKRQNADISNASNAYTNFYIPALLLLSTQIDQDVATRYIQAQWLLLNGTTFGENTNSTYVFCRDVLGYDLAGFFENYSTRIRTELEKVLNVLLEAK